MTKDKTDNKEIPNQENDDRSESERQRDAEIDRLDTFFAGLQPGVSLLIERLKPSWCAGLLEEITIAKDEEIGLDYFIETWGGELLSVKIRGQGGRLSGSYKIPLATYPPLLLGEPLLRPNKRDLFKSEKENSNTQPSTQPLVIANQSQSIDKIIGAIPAIIPLVTAWMKSAEDRRQQDMAMMMQMMRGNQSSGISDITKIGAAMGQLNEIFKSNTVSSESDGMDFIPQALDVLKMVLGNQNSQPTPQPHRLSAPQNNVTNVTQLKTQQNRRNSENIAEKISELDPRSAATVVMDAMSMMPPDKQQEAFAHFYGQYSSLMNDEEEHDVEGDDEYERGIR